jgi:hypothetical protein
MLFNSRRQQAPEVSDRQNVHPNTDNTLSLLGKNLQQQTERYYSGKTQGRGKEY